VLTRFTPAPLPDDYALLTSFGHLFSHPVGYAGGETVQMSYSGLASHAYTTQQQSFSVGIIPLTSLVINMQVINNSGFAQGTYTAKTVLTCS